VLGLLLAGCPRRGPDTEVRLQSLVRASDEAWQRRGQLGLDEAAKPLLTAWSAAPADPRVSWRLARWRLAEGLAAPNAGQARTSYAQAREVGLACLDGDPLFAQRRKSEGWAVALAGLSPERSRCAAWAALAWTRWIEVMGGGAAALDLDTVDALIGSSKATAGPLAQGVARWAEGVLAAVRPSWAGRDLGRAEVALRDAIRADPDSVVRWVDLYRLVVVNTGTTAEQEALRSQILALPAVTPEDQRARTQLEASTTPSAPPP
jgi:hypothetical protein